MPFSHAYMMSQHYIGEIESLDKQLNRRNNVDILDRLKNAISIFKGMPVHVSLCKAAHDEIKLLRTKATPVGYVPLPIVPSDEIIECLTYEWDTVGATSMYDNYDAMIELALKAQKATT